MVPLTFVGQIFAHTNQLYIRIRIYFYSYRCHGVFLFLSLAGAFRKRMRCTTNIYLTALAITDIAYLTFVLILSLKHYEYIKYHCELYWSLYGFIIWLCDACGK